MNNCCSWVIEETSLRAPNCSVSQFGSVLLSYYRLWCCIGYRVFILYKNISHYLLNQNIDQYTVSICRGNGGLSTVWSYGLYLQY